MNLNYSTDKPLILKTMWDIMEDLQDKYPHFNMGWDGFFIMIWWV